MPRFYFFTKDGECVPDREGAELPSLEEAKDTAIRFLLEMSKANHQVLEHTGEFKVIVKDEEQRTVYTVMLSADERVRGTA